MTRVAAFAYVRNEEKNISKVIESLKKQTLPLGQIIIVNDGSSDQTSDIAKNFGVDVIDLPDEHKDKRATPELSKLRNVALSALNAEYDYILHFGGDHIFPPHYVEYITKEMDVTQQLGVCSGSINGFREKRNEPAGSGRIARYSILKSMNMKYPTKYGSESYLLYKSLELGYQNKILDIETSVLRPTRSTYTKNQYLGYGRAAKALGYSSLYFFGRLAIQSTKSINGAYYQLQGFLDSKVELHEESIRQIVHAKQNQRIKKTIKNFFGLSK